MPPGQKSQPEFPANLQKSLRKLRTLVTDSFARSADFIESNALRGVHLILEDFCRVVLAIVFHWAGGVAYSVALLLSMVHLLQE